MQPTARLTKPAIGTAAALTRRNAALVVPAIRILAGQSDSRGLSMGVTDPALSRDNKRDGERDQQQRPAPSVHRVDSTKSWKSSG